MEGAVVAVAIEIELQRFRFHEPAFRDVIDDERGEIWLAGNRADGGKFRKSETRHIVRVRMWIAHALEHRIGRRCGYRHRTAELAWFGPHATVLGRFFAPVNLSLEMPTGTPSICAFRVGLRSAFFGLSFGHDVPGMT